MNTNLERVMRFVHQSLFSVLLFYVAACALRADSETLPKEIEQLRIDQRLGEQVSLDLHFFDEQGKNVRLAKYFQGKPVILVLAYYRCPRLCSKLINDLLDSLGRIPFAAGKDYHVVIVSFDPRESPVLAAANKERAVERYGRKGAAKGLHFLTGEKEQIKRLADAVGFHYEYDSARNLYSHAAGIMMLTPKGKVSRYLLGLEYSPRDLRLGLVETAEERIGSPVDDALLITCLAYDPSTGKYTLSALKLMRAAAAVTVVVLGIYLGWNWWRRGGRKIEKEAAKI